MRSAPTNTTFPSNALYLDPSKVLSLILASKPPEIYPISDKGSLASTINFSLSGTISTTVTPGQLWLL